MLRYLALFALLLVVLFGFSLSPPGKAYIVVPWTTALAAICGGLVSLFDPGVVAQGTLLATRDGSFAVSIEPGCNGLEATWVLLAAIIAYPAPWRSRLIGIATGVVAIQGLNVLRVISLFYLGQWSATLFEWAHLYVWQALIMLDALIVWLLWLRWLQPRPAMPSPAHA